ncbi:hypothetical protein CEXT_234081 [Caerostris extrusa]|uniref:Uncharacterized protein n=1 Tax=Caerostris extrusa TaxID=172846 RepID=A0AAV4X3G4_CAEEX|nr:hypothetical protein CEXT_234081 [Caerostris extrusa]
MKNIQLKSLRVFPVFRSSGFEACPIGKIQEINQEVRSKIWYQQSFFKHDRSFEEFKKEEKEKRQIYPICRAIISNVQFFGMDAPSRRVTYTANIWENESGRRRNADGECWRRRRILARSPLGST